MRRRKSAAAIIMILRQKLDSIKLFSASSRAMEFYRRICQWADYVHHIICVCSVTFIRLICIMQLTDGSLTISTLFFFYMEKCMTTSTDAITTNYEQSDKFYNTKSYSYFNSTTLTHTYWHALFCFFFCFLFSIFFSFFQANRNDYRMIAVVFYMNEITRIECQSRRSNEHKWQQQQQQQQKNIT